MATPNSAAPRALEARRFDGASLGRTNAPHFARDAGGSQPVDAVTFSPEALKAAAALEADEAIGSRVGAEGAETPTSSRAEAGDATTGAGAESSDEASESEGEANGAAPRGADGESLSDAEVEQVRELQARDLEVRQHEQAHVAAGGPYVTSGPNYQYQQGPDGKRYVVGGNVGIDVSAEDTPEKTIAKAQVVRQAALAPAEPSAQDLRVAAQASQLEQQARAELSEQRREDKGTESEANASDSATSNRSDRNTTTEPSVEQESSS
ncbi:MAG: putative metalloprotease CJM1_0395 family protein [Planctomycetota bacterium]